MFTSLWVAYPLYGSVIDTDDTTSESESSKWAYNPYIPEEYQINIVGQMPYGVNYGSTSTDGYDSNLEYYARGHQIPNADRKSTATMNAHTYYVTNSTPQIHRSFNGGIWKNLEAAVRGQIPDNDTLYVVTGAAFQKKGESTKSVTWITPRGETTKKCPVPNFYWKALLKVKRGNDGQVTSASTIGFWLPHENLSGKNYANYAVSVDQIEQWTGFELFVNLPGTVDAAESNCDWQNFQSF